MTKILLVLSFLLATVSVATATPVIGDRLINASVDTNEVPQFGAHYTIIQTSKEISLTSWLRHKGDPNQSSDPYNRTKHFGKWIDDPTDSTCFNTRAKVLYRDSQTDVVVSRENECLIEEGHWKDPYTNSTVRLANELQVDHMVPLKHAFISGAWKWSQLKRCAYANFMGNNFHLITADAHENMVKSDQGPEEYLPPNNKYICTYLSNWLKVKAIWNLTLSPPETAAIEQTLADMNCAPSAFVLSKKELTRQRAKIASFENICKKSLQ